MSKEQIDWREWERVRELYRRDPAAYWRDMGEQVYAEHARRKACAMTRDDYFPGFTYMEAQEVIHRVFDACPGWHLSELRERGDMGGYTLTFARSWRFRLIASVQFVSVHSSEEVIAVIQKQEAASAYLRDEAPPGEGERDGDA